MSAWRLTEYGQFVMDEPRVHAVITSIEKSEVPYDAYELEFTAGGRTTLTYRPTLEGVMLSAEVKARTYAAANPPVDLTKRPLSKR